MSDGLPTQRLRLLYIGPFNSPHVEDLAIGMKERGHLVQAGGEVWGGLPASSLPQQGVPVSTMTTPSVLWLRRLLRDFGPDVVHAHWMPFGTLAMLAGARPLVVQAWGSDVYRAGRRQMVEMRVTLRRTAVVMTDSDDLVDRLKKLGPKSLRTMLVNWGVDLEALRMTAPSERAALKRRFGLGPGPLILSPRGLKEIYNPDIVIASFSRVRDAFPDAQLVLKHSGPDELHQATWSDSPGVHVRGHLNREDMNDLLRAAEVTVSVPKTDSSPRSVWEAMAAGSPTVLSDLPWVHELIVDGRDALVVEQEPAVVGGAIMRLLRDQELGERIAASARTLVERHRNRDVELARLESCYFRLAGSEEVSVQAANRGRGV
jgi:glycosyltransferase involved in cell wall biosynthesis